MGIVLTSTEGWASCWQALPHLVLHKVLSGKSYYAHVTVEKSCHQDMLSNLAEPRLYLFYIIYIHIYMPNVFLETCKMVLNDGGQNSIERQDGCW